MSGLAGSTTFKNTSGQRMFFPYIGLHGVWLNDGQTATVQGDPYINIRRVSSNERDALDAALQTGKLQILASPTPVYQDQNTGVPQVLNVAAGVIEPTDPTWFAAPVDATVSMVSSTPTNNAMSVAANAVISVVFSTSVTGTTFAVKTGSTTVAGTTGGSGKTWTFTPSANLTGGGVYQVTVSAATTASGAVAPTTTFSFSVAPQVSSITPANNATAVADSPGTVTVVFNEAVSGVSVVVTGGGKTVAGSLAMSNSGKTATFTPTASLAAATVYTVTVTGAKDAAGNVMATFTSQFTSA